MQTFIFDYDGTLINSRPVLIESIRRVIEANGLPPKTEAEISPHLGLAGFTLFEDLYQTERQDMLPLYDQMNGFYETLAPELESPFDGILPWLEMLKSMDASLYVCSVRPRAHSFPLLEQMGLTQYMTDVWGNNESSGRDTKAKVLRYELSNAQLDPTQCVMIGDKDFDCQAARAAGTYMLGCSYGYGSVQELSENGSDLIVSSVEQGQQATRVLRSSVC